jgi:hypothetical protein
MFKGVATHGNGGVTLQKPGSFQLQVSRVQTG